MTLGELGRLGELLRAVRRRLRAVWALDTVQLLAPVVAIGALVLVAAGWVLPWPWTDWAAVWLVLALLVVIAVAAVVVRLPDMVVARAADRGLATRDAFATALEIPADVEHFGHRIRERAVRLADEARPADAVPVRWRRRSLLIAAVAVPAVLALALVANPQDARRGEREREAAQIAASADALAATAERLRADPAAAEAVRRLYELTSELRSLDDTAAAEELARRAAAELARAQTPESLATRAATQGLDRNLANEPLPGAGATMDAAAQLDALGAELPGLDATEQAEVAERLDDLAATQQAGDPAAAAALAAAAAAIRGGDLAAAQAALGDAAAANATASAAAEAAATLGEAAAAANAAADGLTDSPGRGDEQGQGEGRSGAQQGDGRGEGQGDTGEGEGQGQGQGQGEGQGDGQGEGGGGGGGGSPSGDVGGGGSGDGTTDGGEGGSGQGTGSAGGREGEEPDLNTIFDPAQGTDGDQVVVGGGEGAGEGGAIGRVDGPTEAGTSRVPLADTITDYRQRATEAMDRYPVAPSDRDLVRDYFDRLQGRS